jgi:LacI family transcriptional regulator
MIQVGLKIRFQDGYDMGVANGVVRYAKSKITWQLRGQGQWFFPLDIDGLKQCDALIARIENEDEALFCSSLGIPIVDIAGACSSKVFSTVRNDDYATGITAGKYLKTLGSSRYAWCGVDNVHWSRERMLGFAASIGWNPQNLPRFSKSLDWWRKIYESSTELDIWIASLEKPVSLFCSNDLAAMKVEIACKHLGLEIPSEVTVLGVDDEKLLCELASPSISSIPPNCEMIGYKAAQMIDSLLENKNREIRIQRIACGPVSERESTSLVLESDEIVAEALRMIRSKVSSGICASDIVDHSSACRRTLESRFKKARGRTIWEEITQQRLDLACKLLLASNTPVQQISEECGFGSGQRFFTLFRRQFGMTPQVWRNTKKL